MAATDLQMGWTNVMLATAPITRVDSIEINVGGQLIAYAGDNDRYNVVVVNNMNDPSVTINCSSPASLMGITPGSEGTFTATHKDAMLATAGDIIYTVINCVAPGASTSGAHAQFGTATIQLKPYAADGATNPISYTRA
jgi:hypothetical protein